MGIGVDRVQVYKREGALQGGSAADDFEQYAPVPITPQEDAIESAGIYVQDATNRDETTYIARSGTNMVFRDQNNLVPLTLTQLAAAGGGGITEAQHNALRSLIHFVDEGPAEGFATGSFKEVIGGFFPTLITWWESAAKLKRIVDKTISRSGTGTLVSPTPITWRVYDTDGVTVRATMMDTITYSGIREVSRTRSIA